MLTIKSYSVIVLTFFVDSYLPDIINIKKNNIMNNYSEYDADAS